MSPVSPLSPPLVCFRGAATAVTFVVLTLLINTVKSYVIFPSVSSPSRSSSRSSILIFTTTPTRLSAIKPNDVVTLSLDKPLGLVLEESDDKVGVVVASINDGGSASLYPQKDTLVGSWVVNVMGKDVSNSDFDTVMETIINAENTVEIAFALSRIIDDDDDVSSSDEGSSAYEVGTMVDIKVQRPATGKPDIIINAKVGDNLRKTLLANPEIELYRGLKKKLGNCGGGGQCGFCAVEFIDDSGEAKVWGTRSEYESKKIGKNGSETQRLACMNNIVGPATVVTLYNL